MTASFSTKIMALIMSLMVVLMVVTAFTVGYPFYQDTTRVLTNKSLEDLSDYSAIASKHFRDNFDTLRDDVKFLANVPAIPEIVRARSNHGINPLDESFEAEWKDRLKQIFIEFLKAKNNYLSVRFIGIADQGRELVRVDRKNGNFVTVGGSQLQQKGNRKYFKDAITLNAGEVYLSKIELNREHGKIVEPYTPVLRAATPVYDGNHNVFGLVIINQHFRHVMDSLNGPIIDDSVAHYVTNGEGDYLYHPDQQVTFGFDTGLRFQIQYEHPMLNDFYSDSGMEQTTLVDDSIPVPEAINMRKVFFDIRDPSRFIAVGSELIYEKLMAEVVQARNETISSAVEVLLVALVITLIFSRLITRPFVQVMTVLKGTKVKSDLLKRDDEIGYIANTFDKMKSELEQQIKAEKDAKIRMKAIFESVNEGIITINRNGIIESVNSAALRLFGFAEEELAGKNVSVIVPEPMRSNHHEFVANFNQEDQNTQIGQNREVVGMNKAGKEFPLEISLSSFKVGGQLNFAGVMTDITERKKTQTMLVTAKEEAERANSAKTQFLSVMNHELRTPMNGVLGMLTLLNDTSLDEEQALYVSTATNSGSDLLDLLNDILDYTSLESGTLDLDELYFDLPQLIRDSIGEFEQRAQEKGIHLYADISDDIGHLFEGDPIRIGQVMGKLLDNAIKFTDKGEVSLVCGQVSEVDGYVALRFEIRDTGIGVSDDQREEIFKPFTQVDSTINRQEGGTGLGLPMAKRLVEAMGGQIGYVSELGQGSTFWFTIRLMTQKEQATA